jgi:Na+/H+ antiporter NhaD/arsenite permease-like protein
MYTLIISVFIIGYLAIALEHPIKINKASSALLTGVLIWSVICLFPTPESHGSSSIISRLMEHLSEISGILFFLLGAMTIVEIIDAHGGFELITNKITTTNKVKLLWIISITTFFMSSVLDNLTTSIIMAALLRKLIHEKQDLWMFAGAVIIAANSGGAWSPIGDVTTIMLWVGGQVTAANIMLEIILPSIVCLIVPVALMSFKLKGAIQLTQSKEEANHLPLNQKRIVLFIGVASLLFVPVFKTITHLPPFMGILLGLSVLWIVTELLHKNKEHHTVSNYSISTIIAKIDTTSILFFLGILLAVAGMQTTGILSSLSAILDREIGNIWIINALIGVFSSIVDNVPLVAGAIGMYNLSVFPVDHQFWELLAYCAGTGGSILIIGSAAGVAIMGILKIDFIWYLKNISLYALAGYFAGLATFYFLNL